jgi:hypothetical protein
MRAVSLPPSSPFSFFSFFCPLPAPFPSQVHWDPLSFTNAGGSHLFLNLRAPCLSAHEREARRCSQLVRFFSFFFFHSLISFYFSPLRHLVSVTSPLSHLAPPLPRASPLAFDTCHMTSSHVASPCPFVTHRLTVSSPACHLNVSHLACPLNVSPLICMSILACYMCPVDQVISFSEVILLISFLLVCHDLGLAPSHHS